MTETDLAINALIAAIDIMRAATSDFYKAIADSYRTVIKQRIDRASALYEHGEHGTSRDALLPLLREADRLYIGLFHDGRGRLKAPYTEE